jgi:transcriptional regulator with XRE-family HTH domain
MDSVLYSRIKSLCEKNSISFYELEKSTGLGNGAISKWRVSNSPSIDKVMRVAQYFNVTTDYLVGISDIETPVCKLLEDKDIITLQRARIKMTPKDRERMMQMLRIGFDYAFDDTESPEE